jgi:hypothetical protein
MGGGSTGFGRALGSGVVFSLLALPVRTRSAFALGRDPQSRITDLGSVDGPTGQDVGDGIALGTIRADA